MIQLGFVRTLGQRLREKKPLIQFVLGPRQVGKTTGVGQFLKKYKGPVHSVLAEESFGHSHIWLREQWQIASEKGRGGLLVVDEIQKIENWSETVKFLWDTNVRQGQPLKCVFLGSSSLQINQGLSESLAGRFEVIGVPHWDFIQSASLRKMTFQAYLARGGYPGSYRFINNPTRWRQYIKQSIVENVLNKDILSSVHIRKPALFRQTVELLFSYPAQSISYTKLLGQLQDRGNAETIKNYIQLLESAFLVKSLEKFSIKKHLSKASSPKIIPLCPALSTAFHSDIDAGHLLEAYVGQILNRMPGDLFYWQEGDREVDYIYRFNKQLWAIEVKSGRKRSRKGLDDFLKKYPDAQPLFMDQVNVHKLEGILGS